MSSATDNDAFPPSPPAPSVFLSYASEDRVAALKLRETLSAAGIDVWYDEQELHGGDAWDQKIRRQIRDCDYFMPVISATTEARKEGYFRREWRLATDRSLDMADDVLFLVPVAIDATSETGARVPDKFLAVQWLRAPGGQATPALHHLMRRILAGDHHALTRAPMAMTRLPMAALATAAPFSPPAGQEPPLLNHPPPAPSPPAVDPHMGAIPPMPPFPHVPEKGGFFHGIKFIAEVLWWALTAAWLLFKRLPRWAQILVTIWLVLTLFSSRGCNRSVSVRDPATPNKVRVPVDEIARAAREARMQSNQTDLAKLGAEIGRNFSEAFPDVAAAGKRLVVVPFARLNGEEPEDKFAHAVFASLYGQLTLSHARDVGLFRQLAADATEEHVLDRGKKLGAAFVLVGNLTGENEARALTVRLLNVKDGTVQWTDSFVLAKSEAMAVANTISENVDPVLPEHPPVRPKK